MYLHVEDFWYIVTSFLTVTQLVYLCVISVSEFFIGVSGTILLAGSLVACSLLWRDSLRSSQRGNCSLLKAAHFSCDCCTTAACIGVVAALVLRFIDNSKHAWISLQICYVLILLLPVCSFAWVLHRMCQYRTLHSGPL